uniref:Uncharacterized protein n=1 Tax=Oryza meridionalis TaxID=40149 RepID=A0A0E0F6A2_9ORYZ
PPEIGALASAGAAQIDLLVASLAHSGELWVGGAALSNRDPARLRPQLGSPRSVPEVGPPATGAPERAGVWGQDPTGVPSSLEGARRRGSCALYHDCNRDPTSSSSASSSVASAPSAADVFFVTPATASSVASAPSASVSIAADVVFVTAATTSAAPHPVAAAPSASARVAITVG